MNKTHEVRLRFWTNDLPKGEEVVAWDSGVALLIANEGLGVKSGSEVIRNWDDLVPAIKRLHKKAGLSLADSDVTNEDRGAATFAMDVINAFNKSEA